MYLIIIDSFSKWIDVKELPDITAETTIRAFREFFSTWGIPLTLVTDNGPTFTSDKFTTFLKFNGVKHIRTAPYHPASNGEAENAVRTFKTKFKLLLTKMSRAEALSKYLFASRSTAHSTTGISPAELQCNRKMRTRFDLLTTSIRDRVELCQEKQRHYFRGKRNINFVPQEDIVTKDYSDNTWREATIVERRSPVTYTVRTNDNRMWKRHTDQIRPRIDSKRTSQNSDDNSEISELPAKPIDERRVSESKRDCSSEVASSVTYNNNVNQNQINAPKIVKKEASVRIDNTPRRSARMRKPRKILDL